MADELQIEKGIPLPTLGRAGRSRWAEFEVGDSAFFLDRARSSLATASCDWGRHHGGRKFATRVVTENGVKGVRVWRVS